MKRRNNFLLEIIADKERHIMTFHCGNLKMAQITNFYMEDMKNIPYTMNLYNESGKVIFTTTNI